MAASLRTVFSQALRLPKFSPVVLRQTRLQQLSTTCYVRLTDQRLPETELPENTATNENDEKEREFERGSFDFDFDNPHFGSSQSGISGKRQRDKGFGFGREHREFGHERREFGRQHQEFGRQEFGRQEFGRERREFGLNLKPKQWSHMENFESDVYEPSATEMTPEEAETYRNEHEISILYNQDLCPAPVSNFEGVGFPPSVVDMLHRSGFESPMPIQAQGWPIALSGRDLIAIGQTGSGKTLGFILPLVMHVCKAKTTRAASGQPLALVVAPTRELAQQIEVVLKKVTSALWKEIRLYSACLFGGSSKGYQIGALEKGVDVVVATPGRLIDLMEGGQVNLDKTTFLVLDEADRMLDMGFEPQIRAILNQIRPDRQMLMWSATWPKEVRDLAQDLLSGTDPSNHVHLNIGSTELQANGDITQVVEVVDPYGKKDRLLAILDELRRQEQRVLVFVQTKRSVDYIDRLLYRERHRVAGIHGDKSQRQRDQVLQDFRRGRIQVLVATDVASRGLDVDDIHVVVNYDFPTNVESYVHRIGRTGRRGRTGTAYTFVTESEDDARLAGPLIKVLEKANQNVSPELMALAERGKKQRQDRRRSLDGNRSRYNREFVPRSRRGPYRGLDSYQ